MPQSFITMIRERNGTGFSAWLAEASRSEIAELRSLIAGISRDKTAVALALQLGWSAGRWKARTTA